MYTIDAVTGALTSIGDAPGRSGVRSLSIEGSGRFLYTANQQDENISAYAIDSNTGTLTEISGSPFPAARQPVALTTIATH
jgi:6-phosphogluconolactonase (cycloisomerase 2 family)